MLFFWLVLHIVDRGQVPSHFKNDRTSATSQRREKSQSAKSVIPLLKKPQLSKKIRIKSEELKFSFKTRLPR